VVVVEDHGVAVECQPSMRARLAHSLAVDRL
jgi:hypothetical protein